MKLLGAVCLCLDEEQYDWPRIFATCVHLLSSCTSWTMYFRWCSIIFIMVWPSKLCFAQSLQQARTIFCPHSTHLVTFVVRTSAKITAPWHCMQLVPNVLVRHFNVATSTSSSWQFLKTAWFKMSDIVSFSEFCVWNPSHDSAGRRMARMTQKSVGVPV